MASSRDLPPVPYGLVPALAGATAWFAWQQGYWGTLIGASLVVIWTLVVNSQGARRSPSQLASRQRGAVDDESAALRLVLDQVPVPIVVVEGGSARALNRSARKLFAAGDRILPPPSALVDPSSHELLLEGTKWRLHRVGDDARSFRRSIVTLVDVSAEERAAETRVSADMIQILGHELLNGLAPIVSLAESGHEAITATPPRLAPLADILSTLSTRAEGLFRFAEAYRAMGRLPGPTRVPVRLSALASDFRRLFDGHWDQSVCLSVEIDSDACVALDRDQITQAIWSIIQNAVEAALAGKGPPQVTLRFRRQPEKVVIEVSDTGPGVDPEAATRIFRPFHTTKLHGTGIGLSVARQIARAHGGDLIIARLRPAVFWMTIPTETLSGSNVSP